MGQCTQEELNNIVCCSINFLRLTYRLYISLPEVRTHRDSYTTIAFMIPPLCGEEGTSHGVALAAWKAPQAEVVERVFKSIVMNARHLEVSHGAPGDVGLAKWVIIEIATCNGRL